jgi:hypothetical protein
LTQKYVLAAQHGYAPDAAKREAFLHQLTAYDYKILERRRALSKIAGTREPTPSDILKPKKSLTPYILFASSFQKNAVGSIVEGAKVASAKWKAMSVSEKQQFVDEAERLRSQQNQELTAYVKGNKALLDKALAVINEVKKEAVKKLSPKKPTKKIAKPTQSKPKKKKSVKKSPKKTGSKSSKKPTVKKVAKKSTKKNAKKQ